MEEGEGIKTPLPEAMIQHIQSYMSRKEAARSAILSKSWHSAWLTRPIIDIDERDFHQEGEGKGEGEDVFEEFAKNTIQRYTDLNLKIERFRLHSHSYDRASHSLIAKAMEIGATDVDLALPVQLRVLPYISLPQEVLASETLARLSLKNCTFEGKYVVRCSRLKSLTLRNVEFVDGDDVFKDLTSCCALEKLVLVDDCDNLKLSKANRYEFHKLSRLVLNHVDVDSLFFTDFASKFPCLKDLIILFCKGWTIIDIASTSLETICFETLESRRTTFDVPNLRKFQYGANRLPSQALIKGCSREWDLDMRISCKRLYCTSWFMRMKRLLTKFQPSRIIFLYMKLDYYRGCLSSEHEVGIEDEAEPLVVENLTIEPTQSTFCCALLVRLFGICRPKFITQYWDVYNEDEDEDDDNRSNESLDILCKILMKEIITPNCGIPDQDIFGKFGLTRVNMKVFERVNAKWRLLVLEEPPDFSKAPERERKVKFELIWD